MLSWKSTHSRKGERLIQTISSRLRGGIKWRHAPFVKQCGVRSCHRGGNSNEKYVCHHCACESALSEVQYNRVKKRCTSRSWVSFAMQRLQAVASATFKRLHRPVQTSSSFMVLRTLRFVLSKSIDFNREVKSSLQGKFIFYTIISQRIIIFF